LISSLRITFRIWIGSQRGHKSSSPEFNRNNCFAGVFIKWAQCTAVGTIACLVDLVRQNLKQLLQDISKLLAIARTDQPAQTVKAKAA